MTKAQRAKLKAAYKRDHPAEPPQPPKQDECNWWEWDEAQAESARLTQRIEGSKAVAERVLKKFQKQLELRKADRQRSKEIRSTGRVKGERWK
ncbi:unnamed protein product [Closterium sp. Yama58-4]|nr:unnamed protein product [Closterium sp. Yama58-4]